MIKRNFTITSGGKTTKIESTSKPIEFTLPGIAGGSKIESVTISFGALINFETEFGKFEITLESEEQARAVFDKLDGLRVSGERIKIQYA